MPRSYRRGRSRPAFPEPSRYTRRDDHTFWAWDRRGKLLGFVYGQSHELRYKSVHTYPLTTVRDEGSYWAWDEQAHLLGSIVKRQSRPRGFDCYLPDGTPHTQNAPIPEKTLGYAWKWLHAAQPDRVAS